MEERRELVEIDLSAVDSSESLQLLLCESLGFPDWYGCNWNAFWDSITGLVQMPRRLRLRSWRSLEARLPGDARLLRECLDEMAVEYPEDAAAVEYA
jgi:RNAse (barnase) inhibitor barstar